MVTPPFRMRMLENDIDSTGRRKVELVVDGPLTTAEAIVLAMQLQELTRAEGERWAKRRGR